MSFIKDMYYLLPIFMQNFIVSIEGLRRKKIRIKNIHFEKWKSIIYDLENYDEERLINWQEEKLSEYIEKAYCNSIFWKQRLNQVGYKKGQVVTKEYLKKIPIINKEDILQNKEKFFNMKQGKNEYIIIHTSGTTGSGLRFRCSKESIAANYSFYWNLVYFKNKLGEKYATFNGNPIVPFQQKSPPFWRTNRAMNQILFSIFHLKKENMKYYLDMLSGGKFKFINGYPSAIYDVANYFYLKGKKVNDIKAIYTSSETLFDWQRKIIDKAFNAPIYDLYSNAELNILAYQCKNMKYHIVPYFSAYWFKETGIEDKNDKLYEIIGTSFLNDSSFFINYRTGDLVVLDKKNQCSCGRKGRIIKRIIGRVEDIIVTPDGRRVGRLDHLFKDSEDVKEAQIIQEKLNRIKIKIVLRKNKFFSKDKIFERANDRLGIKLNIHVESVRYIE